MASIFSDQHDSTLARRLITKPTDPDGLILESWAQGFMVGCLITLSCITIANMRRGVLLHKLILLELVLGYWQGFFIFFHPPVYAWWLSVTAVLLNASWSLHNVIAWMKMRRFLSHKASMIFIWTVILVQPYWVVEIYANFTFYHNINTIFLKTRPWEALCRDPWWIATTLFLFYIIKTKYELTFLQIIQISPRFAVMLITISISVAFIILDVLSVTKALKSVLPVGINPFWKISFVFKCLTDAVVLDDFKTALDKIRNFKLSKPVTADDDVRFLPDGSPAFRDEREFLSRLSMRPWKEIASIAEGPQEAEPSQSHMECGVRVPMQVYRSYHVR